MDKKQIRSIIKERLRALSEESRAEKSKAIVQSVMRTEEYRRARILFLYLSMPEEVDTRPLIAQALSEGKKVLLPRIDGEMMHLVPYLEKGELAPNAYGIPEPTGEPSSDKPDLALIPLLAYDREKRRLGRGKGYYDRFLSRFDGVSFALAFSDQEWDVVPTESFDRRPSAIVTERGIVR